MKGRRWWVGAVVGLVALATSASAQPPLWIAHGRHATIYLFGSVHLLPVGLDWEPPLLAQVISEANELWFELPIDEATDVAAAKLSLRFGYLPAGDTLARVLTPDQDVRFHRVCDRLGLSADAVERLRPWLAEVTLSLRSDEVVGATAENGVEQQLQALAPLAARRRAFETPRQQIGFLAGANPADQIASLVETLNEIESDPRAYQKVVDGWMSGDLKALSDDAIEPLKRASPALYRRLLSDRNARWARVLAHRLDGRGLIVMVVGAGHLVGPDGVPARLRAAGIDVEGP
jgi:uncharacterized protein YbaP (TraB family)